MIRRVSLCLPKCVKTPISVTDSKVSFASFPHGAGKFYATKPKPKKVDWDQTISEAERLVDYPTSFLSLRWLLSDDIGNITSHLHKLVGSNHPSLQIAKNLLYNGRISTQSWGLIILLISKMAGFSPLVSAEDVDKNCGILHKQRALAEVTEMIRIAHTIHRSMVILHSSSPVENEEDMVFGNMMALLTGDYLLCHSSMGLAELRNQIITELMSSAVRDFAESEFLGERDEQNNAIPYKPSEIVSYTTLSDLDDDHFETDFEKPMTFQKYIGIPDKEWEVRQMINAGSVLAKGCQGALILAGQSESVQKYGYFLGKHLALAWQASIDLEPFFQSRLEENCKFSLVGAPILFHLNYDPSSYQEIMKGRESINKIDFQKLYGMIRNGPALQMTKSLHLKHVNKALKVLERFPPSEARSALENIICAMQVL